MMKCSTSPSNQGNQTLRWKMKHTDNIQWPWVQQRQMLTYNSWQGCTQYSMPWEAIHQQRPQYRICTPSDPSAPHAETYSTALHKYTKNRYVHYTISNFKADQGNI